VISNLFNVNLLLTTPVLFAVKTFSLLLKMNALVNAPLITMKAQPPGHLIYVIPIVMIACQIYQQIVHHVNLDIL